jgi:Bacterial membrane protein YfhO
MVEPIDGKKSVDQTSSKDWLAFLIYLLGAGLYFFPVFFMGKNLLIDALDHSITYIRMVERAHWLRQGIVPLWDPKTFSGLSYIDSVPTTHLLNLQAWVMAVFGDHLGYNLVVLAFVVFGAFGTYLLCHRRLRIDWRLSICAGISTSFGPYLGNTYSSIFTWVPFISYFLYYFWVVFEEKQRKLIIQAAIYSALPLSLCFYTQDPCYIEYTFYSTVVLIITAIIIFNNKRIILLRNIIIFSLVSAITFILLIIPILLPLLLETMFNQQRLGSGGYLPPFFQYPSLSRLLNIVLGGFFPVNLAVLHDGARVFLLGSNLTFYFEYIHILFYGTMALGITMYRQLRLIEKCMFWMPIVLIGIIYMAEYVPGLMYLWTLFFKTGRFGLGRGVPGFYGVLAVFMILNKIFEGSPINLQSKAASSAKIIFTCQIVVSVMALVAVVFMGLFGQSALLPYVTSHAVGFARFIGTKQIIDPQTISAVFNSIYRSFLQRIPSLILAFTFLALQIFIVRQAVFFGRSNRFLNYRILYIVLFLTPILLSAAYWPFNNVIDRTEAKTADRQFLSSLSLLDRVDNADLYAATNLTPEQRSHLIPVYSPKSLKWAISAFPPAVVDFVHHFIPKKMYKYFRHIYLDNEDIKNSIIDNERFFFYPMNNNLFHLLGVNYIFSELDLFSYPFKRIGKYGDYFVYQNIEAFPRYYFVDKVTMVDSNDDLLSFLSTMSAIDLKKEALIESASNNVHNINKTFENDGRVVKLISYTPNMVTLKTHSSHDQFLVFTDTFDSKWKVYIDGKPTELYQANFLFRGVSIPPGNHMLKFLYYYPEFKIYMLIAICTLIFILISHRYTETSSKDFSSNL